MLVQALQNLMVLLHENIINYHPAETSSRVQVDACVLQLPVVLGFTYWPFLSSPGSVVSLDSFQKCEQDIAYQSSCRQIAG